MMTQAHELMKYLDQEKYIENAEELSDEEVCKEVLSILRTQGEDIMKLRSENVRLKQNLKQLQEKVTVNAASNNDTQSEFMMPSEFKTRFECFMKQTVSLTLGSLLVDPLRYSSVLSTIMKTYYQDVQSKLNSVLTNIAKELRIDGQQRQLFKQILKIIQDNNRIVLQLDLGLYRGRWSELDQEMDVHGQDFQGLMEQYHNLVVYMLLQEQSWELVFGDNKTVQFSKKEFNCIDGWVKEKEKSLMLLEGLRKGSTMHPNLKNYVIPIPKDYTPKTVRPPNVDRVKYAEQTLPITQQQQKRIKTLQQSQHILVSRELQMSVQMQARIRKPSLSHLPVKVGKIIKQSGRMITQRKMQAQSARIRVEKKPDKENVCLNTNSLKVANYKEIIKRKFKEEKSLVRSRDIQKRMVLYDSSLPSRTERSLKQREGSSQRRKKKEENRPLKPSEEHIAKFRAKHKLL